MPQFAHSYVKHPLCHCDWICILSEIVQISGCRGKKRKDISCVLVQIVIGICHYFQPWLPGLIWFVINFSPGCRSWWHCEENAIVKLSCFNGWCNSMRNLLQSQACVQVIVMIKGRQLHVSGIIMLSAQLLLSLYGMIDDC